MTRTVAIVQARMASTRLPGKVLMDLSGSTVLAHVLERCRRIEGVDAVCCAIPENPDCDIVVAECERAGAAVMRGSESDVLGRYVAAARMHDADVILRVTSDCPLIDPDICASVLALRRERAADFATNNMPPSWPHGLDCEAFTRELLELTDAEAMAPEDREHVSPWMRRAPNVNRVNLDGPGGHFLDHRWTLDYPEDLAFLDAVFAALPDAGAAIPSCHEIDALLADRPDIVRLNASRHESHRHLVTGVVQ